MPRGKTQEEDIKADVRRQTIVRLRMTYPPLSIRQIATRLKCATTTVMNDLKFIRTQFSSEYFAENNRAAVARACVELETLAHQFLTEAETLPLKAYASERAALYGRALQALAQRNDIMLEAGIIAKVPLKIEASGPNGQPMQYDMSVSTIQERIAALQKTLTPQSSGEENE
jgi:hypothetical protein